MSASPKKTETIANLTVTASSSKNLANRLAITLRPTKELGGRLMAIAAR